MEENYEKEINEIMAGMECPRNFACCKSGFQPRCEVKDVELQNHLEIEGDYDFFCKYILVKFLHNSLYFQKYFPVNKMRNFVKNLVQTKYSFYVDVDFVPSLTLEKEFRKVINSGFFNYKKVGTLFQILISRDIFQNKF